MATILFDTSALLRRYDPSEPGAASVRRARAAASGNILAVSRLVSVEIASAFSRKVRDGDLTQALAARLWLVFQGHLSDQYQVVDLTDDVLTSAEQLVFAHPLRAFDAVHVACALVAANHLGSRTDLTFWTADRRQAQAAMAEGLNVRLVG